MHSQADPFCPGSLAGALQGCQRKLCEGWSEGSRRQMWDLLGEVRRRDEGALWRQKGLVGLQGRQN